MVPFIQNTWSSEIRSHSKQNGDCWGKGVGYMRSVFKGYRIEENEEDLEMDSGNGCTEI